MPNRINRIRGQSMPDHLLFLSQSGITPEVSRPPADRVVAGDPVFTTWNLEDRDGIYCGIWRSTPGKWRVFYDEWEYCRIISGLSVLTQDGGASRIVRTGDSFVIRPGFKGIWEVMETTVKDYVIRTAV
jgi:uncharacterized cupin superfamily protein